MKEIFPFTKRHLFLVILSFFVISSCGNNEEQEIDRDVKIEDSIVSIPKAEKGSVSFVRTFCKTPFVLLTLSALMLSIPLVGFVETLPFILSGFSYKYFVVQDIWSIGWKGIIVNWYWIPAVTWHIIVSSIICIGFTFIGGGRSDF